MSPFFSSKVHSFEITDNEFVFSDKSKLDIAVRELNFARFGCIAHEYVEYLSE